MPAARAASSTLRWVSRRVTLGPHHPKRDSGSIGQPLGNWNTNLGIPLDSSTYPFWKNAVNLAAGSSS
jgi:hypothetical protein